MAKKKTQDTASFVTPAEYYQRSNFVTPDQYERNKRYNTYMRSLRERKEEERRRKQAEEAQRIRDMTPFTKDEMATHHNIISNNLAKQRHAAEMHVFSKDELLKNAETEKRNLPKKRDEYRKLNEYLAGIRAARNDAALTGGYTGHEEAMPEITNNGQNKYGIRPFNDYIGGMLEKRQKGELNRGTVPLFMDEEGLNKYISTRQKNIDEARAAADEVYAYQPYEKWADVFDYLDELETDKIRQRANDPNAMTRERADANNELMQRMSTKEERMQAEMARVKELSDKNVINFNFQDTTSPEEIKDTLWKMFTGEFYDESTEGLTPEQKAELDRRMEALVNGRDGKIISREDAIAEAGHQGRMARAYERQIAEAEQAQKFWESQDTFREWIDTFGIEGTGEYDPSLVQVNKYFTDESADWEYEPQGSNVDKAYYWMNNVPDIGEKGNQLGTVHKEYFATPEMVEWFNEFYKYDREHGSNTAKLYLQAIEPYLTTCQSLYQEYEMRNIAMDPVRGPAARFASYITAPVLGVASIANAGLGLLGVEGAADVNNNTINMLNDLNSTVREQQNTYVGKWVGRNVADWLEKPTTFGLGVIDSILDNGMAMGTSKALSGDLRSKMGMNLVQLIMSGEATGHTFSEKLKQNLDPGEAAIYAIGNGIIEWFTEHASLEVLLKQDFSSMIGNAAKKWAYFGKAALAEGSEEINADLLNWGLDYILSMTNGHRTELQQQFDELMESDSSLDPKEAWKQVLLGKLEQIGLSGLAGSISGGLMSGIHYAGVSRDIRYTGKNINSQATGLQDLLDTGMQMPEGSQSRTLAEEMVSKTGRKAGNYDAGRLAANIEYEASEALQNAKTEEEAAQSLKALQSVSEITGKRKGKPSSNQYEGTYSIDENDRLYQEAEGERVEGPRGIVVMDNNNVRHARLDSFVMDDDGALKYKVTVDGQTMTVGADQIRTTNRGMGAVIESQVRNPGFYSQAYVNQMIYDMDQPEIQNRIGDYMIDAALIRYAAFELNSMPQTRISPEVAQRLYSMAQSELKSIRENETSEAKRNAHEAGKGKASLKGVAEFGTQAFDDAINELNISDEQKNNIRTQAAMAVALGTDVTFVDNDYIEELAKKRKDMAQFKGHASELYGQESSSGILINIDGQNYSRNLVTGELESKGLHSIAVTSGHEFMHWLRTNSSIEAYDNLAKYVMDTQRKALGAQGLNEAINDYMDRRGLTLEQAIDEYIADSCDSIFSNKTVLDHVQKTNKTLFGQIRSFVQDLFNRARTALEKMYPSMSKASRNMINTDMRKLGELVNIAWDEAVSRPAEGTEKAEEVAKFSFYTSDGEQLTITEQELYNNMKAVNKMAPSFEVTKEDYDSILHGDFVNKAYEVLIKDGKIAENNIIGAVELAKSGIRHITGRNNIAYAKAMTVPAIKHVIENGEIVHIDNSDHAGVSSVVIAEKIKAPNGNYYVGVLVSQDNSGTRGQKNRYSFHAALIINENIAAMDSTEEDSVKLPKGYGNVSIFKILQAIAKINGKNGTTTKTSRFSQAQVDDEYMAAVENGDTELQQKLVYEAGERAGYAIKAFHGTARSDRVGTVFRPDRATSGPMAYFTDSRDIAENYARNKQDTSIAYDDEYGDYYNQFRINIKGKSMPVGKLWNTLSFADRQKITEAAKHITLDDEAENIIYDENAQHGIGNFTDYERKLHGWNSIDTLIDGWLMGGTLFDREGDFLKVLEMAGIKGVTWNNPDARNEKVYDVLLKIQNPFVVNDEFNNKFIEDISAWWAKQDQSKFDQEEGNSYDA